MNPTGTGTTLASWKGLCATVATTLCLALPQPAAAADGAGPESFHERMTQQLRELQQRPQRGEWVNPWAPGGHPAAIGSADARLQAIVAAHTRAALDRGGWSNPWMRGGRYAAGEPLLAVAVGGGVTSPGEQPLAAAPLLAAR